MAIDQDGQMLTLDVFWAWLSEHRNCVLRAGVGNAWLFDQDELHWHMFTDRDGRLFVQLLRGKLSLGEFSIIGEDVSWVEMSTSMEGEEYVNFEVMGGSEGELWSLASFLMAHAFDEQESRHATH